MVEHFGPSSVAGTCLTIGTAKKRVNFVKFAPTTIMVLVGFSQVEHHQVVKLVTSDDKNIFKKLFATDFLFRWQNLRLCNLRNFFAKVLRQTFISQFNAADKDLRVTLNSVYVVKVRNCLIGKVTPSVQVEC